MTLRGDTRRKRIPTNVPIPTFTPAANAEIHKPTGTNENKINNATIINTAITMKVINPLVNMTFAPYI